jgi:RimJ/RimL family protein N-acetyltransferase
MDGTAALARYLPDLPRWIEIRDLLLAGDAEVFGVCEEPELTLIVRDPETECIFVVGMPAEAALRAAVACGARGGVITADEPASAWIARLLPDWTRARILLHLLPDLQRLPPESGAVRALDPATLSQHDLPAELMEELASAALSTLIAATFVDERPVAFCYAGSVSESLWDVAIDTLAAHRRRGYAAQCAAHVIRHMARQGRQAVWAAVESNPASWRLAQKLGFVVVDELAIFERGAG